MSRAADDPALERGHSEGGAGSTGYSYDETRGYEEERARRRTGYYGDGARHAEPKIIPSLKRVADEAATLFRKEVALLKVEMTNAVNDARTGIASMVTGGAVLYAGLLCLLFAAIMGLDLIMDTWLAALIVGAVVVLVGAILLYSGKKKVEPAAFKPEHTAASLRKDRDMIKERGEERSSEERSHESYAR